MIKAYKAFNKDLTCTMGKGKFQYKEGIWIREREANCGQNGLHCCYNPLDCLTYYGDFDNSLYYLVYADGDIHEDNVNTRISCTKIKLARRLTKEFFVAHACMFMYYHPQLKDNHLVERDIANGKADNNIRIVRGKNPVCKAPIGTVIGLLKEAPHSKEIVNMSVFKIDGDEFVPDKYYMSDGQEVKEAG